MKVNRLMVGLCVNITLPICVQSQVGSEIVALDVHHVYHGLNSFVLIQFSHEIRDIRVS